MTGGNCYSYQRGRTKVLPKRRKRGRDKGKNKRGVP